MPKLDAYLASSSSSNENKKNRKKKKSVLGDDDDDGSDTSSSNSSSSSSSSEDDEEEEEKKETGGNETNKTKTIPLSPPPTYPTTLLKPKRKTGKEIYDGIPKYIRDKIINPEVLINWTPGEEENGEEIPEP